MSNSTNERNNNAKKNIVVSFICQIMTLICGFIVPQMLIRHFGSDIYGVTASIANFLSYIALLEGGISGVARAALYKPLAERDFDRVGSVVHETKRFFRVIGYVFIAYVVVIACSFNYISRDALLDWLTTFVLVVVISISTFGQYFIGISYSVLLQADQRQYITNIINISTTILNTVLVIVMLKFDCSIITVKLISSAVFFLRPVFMQIYVQRRYPMPKKTERDSSALSQKWTALGQHIAYFLHSNTAVAVLTVLGSMKHVAVYSVYYMVTSAMQGLVTSFSAGMESVFGDMLAKNEHKELHKAFGYYDTLISSVAVVMFSSTAVLILPFIEIYTAGVDDAKYIEPLFAFLLTVASYVYCIRLPYHALIMAAGHFKQTKAAAYGEAAINIVVSVLLVIKFGLIGVAIGSLIAVMYRLIYYAVYISHGIFKRNISLFLKRIIMCSAAFALIFFVGRQMIGYFALTDYVVWAVAAVAVACASAVIVVVFNMVFYRSDMIDIWKKVIKRRIN